MQLKDKKKLPTWVHLAASMWHHIRRLWMGWVFLKLKMSYLGTLDVKTTSWVKSSDFRSGCDKYGLLIWALPYTMPINPSELLSTNLIKLSSESDEKCLKIICCCPLFKWQNNCPPTFRLTEHVKAGWLSSGSEGNRTRELHPQLSSSQHLCKFALKSYQKCTNLCQKIANKRTNLQQQQKHKVISENVIWSVRWKCLNHVTEISLPNELT